MKDFQVIKANMVCLFEDVSTIVVVCLWQTYEYAGLELLSHRYLRRYAASPNPYILRC